MLTRETSRNIEFMCGSSMVEIANKYPIVYPLVNIFIKFVENYREYFKVGRDFFQESVLRTILDIFENGENRRNGYAFFDINNIVGVNDLPTYISRDLIDEISHNPTMLNDIRGDIKIIYMLAYSICNLQTIVIKYIKDLPLNILDVIVKTSETKITYILDTYTEALEDNGLIFLGELIKLQLKEIV